jgi:hypothetical protein
MVSTSRTARLPRPDIYIYLDWGSEFALQHGMAFADLSNSGVTVGLGPLGLDYLLAAGGAGYFRLDVLRPRLASGRLYRFTNPLPAPPAVLVLDRRTQPVLPLGLRARL